MIVDIHMSQTLRNLAVFLSPSALKPNYCNLKDLELKRILLKFWVFIHIVYIGRWRTIEWVNEWSRIDHASREYFPLQDCELCSRTSKYYEVLCICKGCMTNQNSPKKLCFQTTSKFQGLKWRLFILCIIQRFDIYKNLGRKII